MASIRYHQAYLSIACTGPAYSEKLEIMPRIEVPRGAADIRLTTADIDYFEKFWRRGHYDGGQAKIHRKLENPSEGQFLTAVQDIENWFASVSHEDNFHGGELTLTFAGHGRRGSGNLVLKESDIDVDMLIGILIRLKKTDHSIKVSLLLDSCFSGAFIFEFTKRVIEKYLDDIVIDYLGAASLHDEVAKESAQFGHGFFTYCFSCRPDNLGTYTATAVQADNSIGPSLSIASGALGCSILTQGTQNPVIIEGPMYHASCLGEEFSLIDDEDMLIDPNTVIAGIENLRDRLKRSLKMLRPDTTYKKPAPTLDEIRTDIDSRYEAFSKIKR